MKSFYMEIIGLHPIFSIFPGNRAAMDRNHFFSTDLGEESETLDELRGFSLQAVHGSIDTEMWQNFLVELDATNYFDRLDAILDSIPSVKVPFAKKLKKTIFLASIYILFAILYSTLKMMWSFEDKSFTFSSPALTLFTGFAFLFAVPFFLCFRAYLKTSREIKKIMRDIDAACAAESAKMTSKFTFKLKGSKELKAKKYYCCCNGAGSIVRDYPCTIRKIRSRTYIECTIKS